METTTDSKNSKKKRGQRGAGYLYKRAGKYWLEYMAGGERVRRTLKDVNGNALTTTAP